MIGRRPPALFCPQPGRTPPSGRILLRACAALAVLLSAGCLGAQPQAQRTASPVPSPTPTFAFPTLPPTATPTAAPTLAPTPDPLAGLGPPVYADDFSRNNGWDLTSGEFGASSIQDGRLVLVVRQPNAPRYVISPGSSGIDFYLQVQTRTDLCSAGDEYGVMFRMTPNGDHYRFTLSCDGAARVTRVLDGSSFGLVPLTATNTVLAGAPADNLIGVWASGDQLRFFINGLEAFAIRSGAIRGTGIGLIVRSGRAGQVSVGFDDLLVRSLQPAPTAESPAMTTPE